MNFVNTVAARQDMDILVCTTERRQNSWHFGPEGVRIARLGRQASKFILRYFCYFLFNTLSVLKLLLFRPAVVMYYETYSAFPAWLYKKLFPKTRLVVHYHEYTSLEEYSRASGYVKWLLSLEKQMAASAVWISHTNTDRKQLFYKDHRDLHLTNLNVLPNYPPLSWYSSHPSAGGYDVKKMVYVGALSMDSMYTQAIIDWVADQNGRYELDIYSDNMTDEVRRFILSTTTSLIRLKEAVDYFSLPRILSHYDIGLVLYNGHIPNYVYNVPNKLMEYYANGLEVWCSKDLISVVKFQEQEQLPGIRIVDFNDLTGSVGKMKANDTLKYTKERKIFSAEAEYSGLLQRIS